MHRLYKKENGRTFLLQKSSHSLLSYDAAYAKSHLLRIVSIIIYCNMTEYINSLDMIA